MPLHVEDEPFPASAPIDYAKPQGPTRRQFSLLLLLVFINTVMFAAFFCLPAISPTVKQTWADYQARKAAKEKEQQRQAMLQQVKTYTAPPNQVIYEEDPVEIQKLYAASSDWTTCRVSSSSSPGYPSALIAPILHKAPPPLARLQATAHDMIGGAFSHNGIPFLHARNDPAGREYLVCVTISPQVVAKSIRRDESAETYRFVFDLKRTLYLAAYAVPADGSPRNRTVMYFEEPGESHGRVVYTVSRERFTSGSVLSRGEPQRLHRSLLRVLAGQPDRNDSTHFTIPYILNGKPGVIDGFLRANGRVMLEPRVGHLDRWRDANTYNWSLAEQPATGPAQSNN